MSEPTATTTTTQADGTPPPASPPPATTSQASTPSAEVTALMERVSRMEAENKTLADRLRETTDEAAQRRISEKKAKEAAEAEARRKGELDTVVKSLEEKLAEERKERERLAGLEDDAKAYRKWVTDETAAIDTKAGSLPVHWQAAIKAAPGLDAKRAIVAAYDAERKAAVPSTPAVEEKKPASPAPPGGAPPSTPGVQIVNAATATPEELKQLKATSPDAYYRAIGGASPAAPKKSGVFEKLFGA